MATAIPRRLAAALMLLAAALAMAMPAQSRPGTPDRVRVWECSGSSARPPRICAEFFNTAERVSFWIEFTADGAPFPLTLQGIGCITGSATYVYRCVSGFAHGRWSVAGITNHDSRFHVRDGRGTRPHGWRKRGRTFLA
jgi:hypothetical protein